MKESNVKKIGVAIVFISILLVYTNLVVETFNEKTEFHKKRANVQDTGFVARYLWRLLFFCFCITLTAVFL